MTIVTRRGALSGLALGAGGLLAGCDRLNDSPAFRKILFAGEEMNLGFQRALTDRNALAREFAPEDRSPVMRSNGTRDPGTSTYNAHRATGFSTWRIPVEGMVQRPMIFSLAHLRSLQTRSQITRHDCVEGWSAIAKWTGTPLKSLFDVTGLREGARFIVFQCADYFGSNRYYETIDLVDAFHPQTILAWGLNDRPLPVENGAPVRLRVERHLGYKHAKYIERIQVVPSLGGIGLGRGGFWEDHHDYDWYAGI